MRRTRITFPMDVVDPRATGPWCSDRKCESGLVDDEIRGVYLDTESAARFWVSSGRVISSFYTDIDHHLHIIEFEIQLLVRLSSDGQPVFNVEVCISIRIDDGKITGSKT